jgi:hypothetical protein
MSPGLKPCEIVEDVDENDSDGSFEEMEELAIIKKGS